MSGFVQASLQVRFARGDQCLALSGANLLLLAHAGEGFSEVAALVQAVFWDSEV
ncbi:hypothetical protein LFL97_23420 [Burkholderia sp. JSH-S8]|nr:hypothetical protein LFL97_23420 [Burkholderia sp. JSH-S8]